MPYQKSTTTDFNSKVSNFPERVYGVYSDNTRIHKLMWALLEVGIGRLNDVQALADMGQQSLSGTAFAELDDFFSFLGITRLPKEKYSFNPSREPLTLAQWQEIISKDSMFRMRILKFMQALTRGGTIEGLEMVAEAASGVRCRILETWRVTDNQVIDVPEWNGYRPAKNFLIVPAESITQQQKAAIIHLIDLVKPADSVCSVLNDSSDLSQEQTVSLRWIAASNHYYTITKQIKADTSQFATINSDIVPNTINGEAPIFAYMDTMEQTWDLNGNINSARVTVQSSDYNIKFGYVVTDNYPNSNTIVVVTTPDKEPNSPIFNIKIGNEIMTVIDRRPISGYTYTYEVLRGQENTEPTNHSTLEGFLYDTELEYDEDGIVYNGQIITTGGDAAYTNVMVIESVFPVEGAAQASWKIIPPMPNDTRRDVNGNIISLWGADTKTAEQNYANWFKQQVRVLGGEISGNQYRFPLEYTTNQDIEFKAEDAIANPSLEVITVVLPGSE